MRVSKFLLILCLFLGFSVTEAKPSPSEFEHLHILVPKGWQKVKEMFGIPLMILGPMTDGARPTVSFSSTDREGLNFDPIQLKQNEAQYRNGREAWLTKHKGKALEFFPYKFENSKGSPEIHTVGYRFVINDIKFIEKSYYFVCSKKIYLVKTLLRSNHENEYADTAETVARSLKCK
jgi:hypothetical protein